MSGQSILIQVAGDVVRTFQANWIYLVVSIVLASAIQVFVGTDRLAQWLRARTLLAVVGAVALGALTPFCSCGTTAVVLGALASAVPWAPVVAFMVSSPLTSPGEYVLSVGLFGTVFATTYLVAAFVLGIGAGWVTHRLERVGWLKGQHRVAAPPTGDARPEGAAAATSCSEPGIAVGPSGGQAVALLDELAPATDCCAPVAGCCDAVKTDPSARCGTAAALTAAPAGGGGEFVGALLANGRRLAVLFFGFTAVGYLLIRLVPTQVLTTILGEDGVFAVPLAALLGVPVYLSSDGSLPLVATLMDGGMGSGAAMAFLITGAGTSVGAVSGMLLIARWRVVALVVVSLIAGAVVAGYLTPVFA